MKITGLALHNWMNYSELRIDQLSDRVFIIGGNAVGKSNLMEALAFLRDVAAPSATRPAVGGLQEAVNLRGGFSNLRFANAASDAPVAIEIRATSPDGTQWRYHLAFNLGKDAVEVATERVWRDGRRCLDRPSPADRRDPPRLRQTHLEQTAVNGGFRDLVQGLGAILFFYPLPQLNRPNRGQGCERRGNLTNTADLIREIGETPARERNTRLARLRRALRKLIPQFSGLRFVAGEGRVGPGHLEIDFRHWKTRWRRADCLSDGSFRLLGLLWSLSGGDSPLLIEEPEISLNENIVAHLAALISASQKRDNSVRQVFVSTHSQSLLSDPAISPEEVLRLASDESGTIVKPMDAVENIMSASGLTVADVLLQGLDSARHERLSRDF